MKKKIPILLGLLLIILVAGSIVLYKTGSEDVAKLYITQGTVEVNLGEGFVPAVDEMQLLQGAIVRTGPDGRADIVLLEQDIVSLNPGTEVKLSDITPSRTILEQREGSTWNRVEKITGREYVLETPSSVATVRGTGFLISSDTLLVDDGQVDLKHKESGEEIAVTAGELIRQIHAGELKKEDLSVEDLKIIREKVLHDIEVLKRERRAAFAKHKIIYQQMKKKYGLSDEDVYQFLEDLDSGKRDFSSIEDKLPFKPKVLEKMKRHTQRIQTLQKRLERIDARIAELS
ncbi:hypothetical protein D6774_02700 [Candidatus Woesearchaeota archaeon]|nr:MAG: hypothetical protein D6774_02700 [Candidatus Woesearchaeota archaeon]